MRLYQRTRLLNDFKFNNKGPVLYWMSRDQRTEDNWSLYFSQHTALKKKVPLIVVFVVFENFLNANIRHYDFMINGLKKIQAKLKKKDIPFFLIKDTNNLNNFLDFINSNKISVLVSDFDPLLIKRRWQEKIKKSVNIPFYEVDAHNIVPCWQASYKREYSARTFRIKINKKIENFLTVIPQIKKHPYKHKTKNELINWEDILKFLNPDYTVPAVRWIKPGEDEAKKNLKIFLSEKLNQYVDNRNNPNYNVQSNLSAYIHFGHISAQFIALSVKKSKAGNDNINAFLEELIIRRELADNYCFYSKKYDNLQDIPVWSKKTLEKHKTDKRKYTYSVKQFENALTHDNLWNSAQLEMVKKGKMHGYLRMYWAKKILEWSKTPGHALKTAIYLNNKYELDGRDPNGYVGCLWSIGGVHDRPWPEREIFGNIRYMNYKGCASKFNIEKYIQSVKVYK